MERIRTLIRRKHVFLLLLIFLIIFLLIVSAAARGEIFYALVAAILIIPFIPLLLQYLLEVKGKKFEIEEATKREYRTYISSLFLLISLCCLVVLLVLAHKAVNKAMIIFLACYMAATLFIIFKGKGIAAYPVVKVDRKYYKRKRG